MKTISFFLGGGVGREKKKVGQGRQTRKNIVLEFKDEW